MDKKINYVLAILILISLFILIYRYSLIEPPEDEYEPKLPKEGIINIHEHIHRTADAPIWLEAMDNSGVSATVMVGSPKATFLLSAEPGFHEHDSNNEVILWLEKKYDSKILAFPTIDPNDPNKLDKLQSELKSGAIGLKLYSGHTGEIFPEPKTTLYDYQGPLDRSDMYGVYEYCEKNKVPIIWHIKLFWDYLWEELNVVLSDFPELVVSIPHFGVLGSNLTRLENLMDNFPGIYTDVSFGGFAYWGIQRVSENIEVFQDFVPKYSDRILFGTDMVMTNNVRKTVQWIGNLTMGYRHMLEKDEYYVNVPNITGEGFDLNGTLKGMGLDQEILDKIYFENAIRFLNGKGANNPNSRSNIGLDLKIYLIQISISSIIILIPVVNTKYNFTLIQKKMTYDN
jgi:predicted TIM-barrel fold metal-dependent hydrolase